MIENNPLDVAAPGVLANDSGTAGHVLAVSAYTQPVHGSVVLDPDGSFRYSPAANYNGIDSFTYTVADGTGNLSTATVNFNLAHSEGEAFLFAGPRLASVDSTQGPLLDAVATTLLGSSVNLSVLDWNALANGQVEGASLASALQAELGLSSPSQALAADATLLQIINATATAAQAHGNTAQVGALNNLAAQVSGLTGTIKLGDLLQVDPNNGALADVDLDTLDLVTGAVQLYNFENVATTPAPITLSGATLTGLGLPATVGSAQLSAQVVEPPIFTHGPAGTQFHTAAIRLKLDLGLTNANLDTSSLLGPIQAALGATADIQVNAALGQVSVYAEVARAQGTISLVDVVAQTVQVQASPGVADLYVGTIPDALFFNRGHVIDPATDLDFADVGTLAINATVGGIPLLNTSAAIQAKTFALGQSSTATTLNFNGPYPETQTVTSSADFLATFLSGLTTNLAVQLNGSLGVTLDAIVNGTLLPLLTPVVANTLTPLVSSVATGLVDPTLGLLGTGIGEEIVTVAGIGVTAPPIANADFATGPANAPISVPVLANDAAVAGDTLTVASVTQGSNGAVTINGDGTVTYTPNGGFTGTDTFTYTVTNGNGGSSTATVTISVTPPAAPPTAANDAYSTVRNTTLEVSAPGVLGNDTSPGGTTLTPTVVNAPAHGSVTLRPDGSFTYIPNANYTGTDSFTYRDTDGAGLSGLATVNLTINAAPLPPVARNDSFTSVANATLSVLAPGVQGNDSAPNGKPLISTLVNGPTHGTLTFRADGSFTYVPDDGFTGQDSFTYRDSDGLALSDPATVTLTINPSSQPPVANADVFTTPQGTPLTAPAPGVLGNDVSPSGRPLTPTIVTAPAHGSVAIQPDGSFLYTPDPAYVGTDSFAYQVSDGTLASDPATVTISVGAPASAPPVANDDSLTVPQNGDLVLPPPGILGNDTDPESRTLTAVLVTSPAHGTLTLDSDGSLFYSPDANFQGSDTFTYRVFNGLDLSEVATVTIAVTPTPHAPVANDDVYAVSANTPVSVAAPGVLANDFDADGQSLTAMLVTPPAHGTVMLHPDGSFDYVPFADYSGPDSFTYRSSDGDIASNVGTVNLVVAPSTVTPTEGEVEPDAVLTVYGVQSTPLTNVLVGRLTATDPTLPASSYTAQIDWGDGTAPTVGTITIVGGKLEVRGTHTYQEPGTYQVAIVVTTPGNTANVPAIAIISPLTGQLTGTLDPGSDTGASPSDGITNDNTPTFTGQAPAGDLVTLYAVRADVADPIVVGQAIADASGNYRITSQPLPDGFYNFVVQSRSAGSFSGPAVESVLVGSVTIDTTGPTVSNVVLVPGRGVLLVTFRDTGAGLDPASVLALAHYKISRAYSANPQPESITGARIVSTAPNGDQTVQLTISRGRRVTHARFLYRIASGGVRDLAGNALDGEFNGQFPSGNGVAGGDFLTQLDFDSRHVFAPSAIVNRPVQRRGIHPRGPVRMIKGLHRGR